MLDSLQEIFYVVRHNKLRTFLTAFGVFWGIFMLMVLLGSGRGLQNGVMSGFGSDILDWTLFYGGKTSIAYQGLPIGRTILLTTRDIEYLKQQLPGLDTIAGEVETHGVDITYKDKSTKYGVYGRTHDYYRLNDTVVRDKGRFINALDQRDARKVALIGRPVAERLFGIQEPIGEDIWIAGVVFKVVGVFYDKGSRGQDSERVIIPQSTYYKVFNQKDYLWRIFVRPSGSLDAIGLEDQIKNLLKARHQVAPQDLRGIGSFSMAKAANQTKTMFSGINLFLWFVGLGTLAAGIVGISNIMIITVKERTREIGIRKALGASPFSIVGSLLTESILVTVLAGYVGLVLGIGLMELINQALIAVNANLIFFKNPGVDLSIALSALTLLVVAGLFAGLAPALHAARISPIEAMRAD